MFAIALAYLLKYRNRNLETIERGNTENHDYIILKYWDIRYRMLKWRYIIPFARSATMKSRTNPEHFDAANPDSAVRNTGPANILI